MEIIPKVINDTINSFITLIDDCPDDPKDFIKNEMDCNFGDIGMIYAQIHDTIHKKLKLPMVNGAMSRDYYLLEFLKNHSMIDNKSIHVINLIYLISDTYDTENSSSTIKDYPLFDKKSNTIKDFNYYEKLKNLPIDSVRLTDFSSYIVKQDSKLFSIYSEYLELSALKIKTYCEKQEIEILKQKYNDRLNLLIQNEDYNFNKFQIIKDTKQLTEYIFAYIDCTKQNQFRFSPGLFEYRVKQLTESDDYLKIKYNITENFKEDEELFRIVTETEKLIYKLFKAYIYRGLRANTGEKFMKEDFKPLYLKASEFIKDNENDIDTENFIIDTYEKTFNSLYDSCKSKINNNLKSTESLRAKLSIRLNNSFHINFENLFPRSGTTTRAIYQTLCRIAESNSDSIIQYTSFKRIALKCSTKIGHDTVKAILHKLHDRKLINYIYIIINGREFIQSIEVLDNFEFVTLENTVDTKFFKSDLASIPKIGKRGNEVFWILNDYEDGLTKREVFRLYPGVSSTTPIAKKLNDLVELGFVIFNGKIYKTDFNNFLLKLDEAKQNITRINTVKSKVVSFANGIKRIKYKNNRDTIKNYEEEQLRKIIELAHSVKNSLLTEEKKENFSIRKFIKENLHPEEFDLVSKIKTTYNIASTHYLVRQFQKYQEESLLYAELKKKDEIRKQIKIDKEKIKKLKIASNS